jgi:hypothetical protein
MKKEKKQDKQDRKRQDEQDNNLKFSNLLPFEIYRT